MLLDYLVRIKSWRRCISVKGVLPIVWIVGILLGKCTAGTNTGNMDRFMLSVVTANNSLICEIVTSSFWLYLAYLAFHTKPAFVLLIAFVKAWGIGFFGAACSIAFKSAGWLIRGFLLFPSYTYAAVFLLFCYFGFQRSVKELRSIFLKLLPAAIAMAVIDHFLVSCYLVSLF